MVESHFTSGRVLAGDGVARRLQSGHNLLIGAGSEITFVNSSVRSVVPDVFVLCLTLAPDASCWPDDYDAVLDVPVVESLADALQRSHPDKLGPCSVARVDYQRRRFDPMQEDPGFASAFVKEDKPDFVAQAEVRICWAARDVRLPVFNTFSAGATRFLKSRP
jgi:hypothetical protein